MSTWLVVWFVISIVATAAVIACLVALVRHVLLVGRTARRFQDELAPLTGAISSEADRASRRASALQPPSRR
jgi:hypothetical protein